ncbi:MAG: HEAT repeat domain-containing protein [Candidatus Gastranaerophilales bacterium]|nr:HEAT repeat domain-containing protein [Candidatus Gastranaerophilales bacterium]
MREVKNIIEALGKHSDNEAVAVLEKLGTNSKSEEVRLSTARALVQRNTHESLKIVLMNEGKGINDMNSQVFEETINEILKLEDKTEVMKILEDTIKLNSNEQIRNKASQVKLVLSASE